MMNMYEYVGANLRTYVNEAIVDKLYRWELFLRSNGREQSGA